VILFSNYSQKVKSITSIGYGVVVFGSFVGFCPQQSFLSLLELIGLHAAESELVSISISLAVFQNCGGFVELTFSHVAICQQASRFFIVLFSQKSLSQESSIGVEVVGQGVINCFNELVF
jgi:hypothetical protein